MTNKVKVLYMGTPDFAVPALKVLEKREDIDLVGVVTQPDKQRGRGHKFQPTPVKVAAEELKIPVFQPEKVKDEAFLKLLEELSPELIVVAAYGKILPAQVINYPKYGCINIHASLLPKYRGAAPIHWCLINGEQKTGVTIMQMDEGLDTGDMLYQKEYTITDTDTTGVLFEKMSDLGALALDEALYKLFEGTLVPEKQDDCLSCYSPMIDKDICKIDFNKTAKEISNLVRGLNPFPGAKLYTSDGKMYKILFAEDCNERTTKSPGTIIDGQNDIKIAAGEETVLKILTLQPEGGKAMSVNDYLRGHLFDKEIIL